MATRDFLFCRARTILVVEAGFWIENLKINQNLIEDVGCQLAQARMTSGSAEARQQSTTLCTSNMSTCTQLKTTESPKISEQNKHRTMMDLTSRPNLISHRNPADPMFFHPSAHPLRPPQQDQSVVASMNYSVSTVCSSEQSSNQRSIKTKSYCTNGIPRPSTIARQQDHPDVSSLSSDCAMAVDTREIELFHDGMIETSPSSRRRYSVNDIVWDSESSLSNSATCNFMSCLLRIAQTLSKMGPMPDPWIEQHYYEDDDEDTASLITAETSTFSTDSLSDLEDAYWAIK